MPQEAVSCLDQWNNWTTLCANIVTVLGFVLGGIAAFFAGRKFFAERRYDEYVKVYGLANDLWRAGLTVQKRRRDSQPISDEDRRKVYDAKNALTNWYYDNRFLFSSDPVIAPLMKEIDDEADQIIQSQAMDDLRKLREHLENELKKAP
jgi:hypothetical protein